MSTNVEMNIDLAILLIREKGVSFLNRVFSLHVGVVIQRVSLPYNNNNIKSLILMIHAINIIEREGERDDNDNGALMSMMDQHDPSVQHLPQNIVPNRVW